MPRPARSTSSAARATCSAGSPSACGPRSTPPDTDAVIDECADWRPSGEWVSPEYETPQEVYERSVPSWFVGLAVHALLGAGALLWAWRRTRVPAKRLPAGSRVA